MSGWGRKQPESEQSNSICRINTRRIAAIRRVSIAHVESPRLSEHLSRKDGRGGSAEDESQTVAERRSEVGMLQEIELRSDARIISLVIYAIVGWVIIVAVKPLLDHLEAAGLI